MTLTALLAELRSRDIQLWLDGDQLKCNAPVGVLTPALRDELRQFKGDVIQFLRSAESFARQQRGIVPLQHGRRRVPVFAVPGHNGDPFLYRALAQRLGNDQPFFGLQPPGLDDGRAPLMSVHDLASYFVAQIREFRPDGPYALAGYCAGATIAYEIAQQLIAHGAKVSLVVMFAGEYPTSYRRLPQLFERCSLRVRRVRKQLAIIASKSWRDGRRYVAEKFRAIAGKRDADADPILHARLRLMRITAAAVAQYKPEPLNARLCLILSSRGCIPEKSILRWRDVTGDVDTYYGPDGCESDVMLQEPFVNSIAELIGGCLCN